MAMIPRSRRGIWLVAFGVWLAACAGWWWMLAVVPTNTLAFDEATVFAFHPDGRKCVTVNAENVPRPQDGPARIHAWDIESGREVGKPLNLTNNGLSWRSSRDLRWWFVTPAEDSQPPVRVLDVLHWRIEDLTDVPRWQPSRSNPADVSSDGQLLLIGALAEGRDELIVWDLAERRIRTRLRDASLPGDAVRETGLVVAAIRGADDVLNVFDLNSGQRLRSLPSDDSRIPRRIRLSVDGAYAAASYEPVSPQHRIGLSLHCPLRCWDVAAGRLCDLATTVVAGSFGFVHDRLVWVSSDATDQTIQCCSPQSGRPLWARSLGLSKPFTFDLHDISPDGRFISIHRTRERTNSWVDWLMRRGFLSTSKWQVNQNEVVVLDTMSGGTVCSLPGAAVRWSPDSQRIVTVPRFGELSIWDIPPRKSLIHFFAGAALLALPIAFVARRRDRTMRAA